MLKRTITAEAYNSLPDDVKEHYVKRGSKYVVDLEGSDPELEATQTALDKARKDNIELSSQVRTLTEEAKTAADKVRGEVEQELKTLRETNEKAIESLTQAERDRIVNSIAENFSTPELISASLRDRVEVKYENGKVVATLRDAKGAEVDEKALADEYCKNPSYAAILKGKGNTGSFKPPSGSDGKEANANQNKDFVFATATPAEKAAYLKASVTE